MPNPYSKGNPNWKKGVSANPSGRPKGAMILAKYIIKKTKGGKQLVDLMLEIAFGGTGEIVYEVPDRIAAVKWLGERGFGKPSETIQVGGIEDGAPIKTEQRVPIFGANVAALILKQESKKNENGQHQSQRSA